MIAHLKQQFPSLTSHFAAAAAIIVAAFGLSFLQQFDNIIKKEQSSFYGHCPKHYVCVVWAKVIYIYIFY